jgi:hypothetical protein
MHVARVRKVIFRALGALAGLRQLARARTFQVLGTLVTHAETSEPRDLARRRRTTHR